ncbi:hypothetical protein [Acidocella sp.]|uniref:hypothetical protein n=1 Tax=Acidocella sp. TaxID=50710 RepID=UPI00261C0E5A|nr:hypothetical protein [Acidocella sp.]
MSDIDPRGRFLRQAHKSLGISAKSARMGWTCRFVVEAMHFQSAKDAKYRFAPQIDLARAEPAVVEKHGCPVVAVLSIEEYQQPVVVEATHAPAGAAAAYVSGKSHD